jgi:hypothetical protein
MDTLSRDSLVNESCCGCATMGAITSAMTHREIRMSLSQTIIAFATPYALALLATLLVQRLRLLPSSVPVGTLAQNTLGRLSGRQRLALALYHAPELIFALAALLIAFFWRPEGLNGAALRWGLAGMALVRLGLSWPVWRDLFAGRVASLSGPLRKIAFRHHRALATEDGPLVVLPVESAIWSAYESGVPATIFFAPYSKRVVAVQPQTAP